MLFATIKKLTSQLLWTILREVTILRSKVHFCYCLIASIQFRMIYNEEFLVEQWKITKIHSKKQDNNNIHNTKLVKYAIMWSIIYANNNNNDEEDLHFIILN